MNNQIEQQICEECKQSKPSWIFQSGLGLVEGFCPTQWGTEICIDCFYRLMHEADES